MKSLITLFICIFVGTHVQGQDLFPIFPLNVESSYAKNGYYFPEHSVKIKNGTSVFFNDKLIKKFNLENYYYYVYEIFENADKQQYLLVSALQKSEDPGSLADFTNVRRNLGYIICLDDENSMFYLDFDKNSITSKLSFDYYSGGTVIESIDEENKVMVLLSGDKGKERKIEIKLFDLKE